MLTVSKELIKINTNLISLMQIHRSRRINSKHNKVYQTNTNKINLINLKPTQEIVKELMTIIDHIFNLLKLLHTNQ